LLTLRLLTSNTAKQLLSALAMYNVFSSVLNARPFEVEPGGEFDKALHLMSDHFQCLCIDQQK
jgi:hypothetical protein